MIKHDYKTVPLDEDGVDRVEARREWDRPRYAWRRWFVAAALAMAWFVAVAWILTRAPGAATTAPMAATAGAGCRMFHNRGTWANNFTAWRLMESERHDLASFRDFVRSAAPAGRPRHVLLTGDSTISKLNGWLPLAAVHGTPLVLETPKWASRCQLMDYVGLPRAERWTPPDLTVEGPVSFGLENHFCTDCAGCEAMLRKVVDNATNESWSYEFLPVEFARDREMQTADGAATTQETVARYLAAAQQQPRELCILSAALHDLALNATAAQLGDNVLEYLAIMRPYCRRIVWLLPSATLGRAPQTHPAVLALRQAVRDRCAAMDSNVLLLDIWDMSLPAELHTDDVHHVVPYYDALGRLLLLPEAYEAELAMAMAAVGEE